MYHITTHNTVGIWIMDSSGIQMVENSPIIAWFAIQITIWIPDSYKLKITTCDTVWVNHQKICKAKARLSPIKKLK